MLVARGEFRGTRVISESWVDAVRVPRTAAGEYGYLFWILPDNSYQAHGHGGQVIRVVPHKDVVVIMTADPYSDEGALSPDLQSLIDRVVAASRDD
jgi:CubicO group peptidase (beta-lactamase class C family)